MRVCNSLKLNWGNDLCLVAHRLQISTAHFSPFHNIASFDTFLLDASVYDVLDGYILRTSEQWNDKIHNMTSHIKMT